MKKSLKSILPDLTGNQDALFALLLALLPLVYFWKALFGGCDLFYDDIAHTYYSYRSLLFHIGQSGHFWSWNPYEFCGMSTVGDIQKGLFYPLNILFYLLPTGRAITFFVVIHFILQELMMYLWLRKKGIVPVASLCGALIYTFSSFTVLHLTLIVYLPVTALFPLLMYVIEDALDSGKMRYFIYGGIVLALMFLSGLPQQLYYICMILALFFMVWACMQIKGREAGKIPGRALGFLVMGALALSLSALQLFPFYELSKYTVRAGGTTLTFASSFCVEWAMLKTLLVPFLYGNPFKEEYTGAWNFFEAVNYWGLISLFLMAFGIGASRDRFRLSYGILLAVSFGAALGKNFLLFPLFFKVLPYFGYFRAPCRLMHFVDFVLAMYAAYGLQRLLSGEWKEDDALRRRLFSAFLALLIAFVLVALTQGRWLPFQVYEILWALALLLVSFTLLYLYLQKRAGVKLFSALCILVVLVDLWSFGMRYVQNVPREKVLSVFSIFRSIPPSPVPFRVCTNTSREVPNYLIIWNIFPGCESIQGHNSMAHRDLIYYLFYNEAHRLPEGEYLDRLRIPSNEFNILNYRTPMIDLLNTRYYCVASSRGVVVEENRNFRERFFFVDNVRVEKEREKILFHLSQDQYAPEKGVFIEEPPGNHDRELMRKLTRKDGAAPGSRVSIQHYSAGKISLACETDIPRLLFMSEIYYPGWKAAIDGQAARIFRTNYTFRGLFIPPGRHEVTLWYDPASFRWGYLLTFSALGILAALALFHVRGTPKRRAGEPGGEDHDVA